MTPGDTSALSPLTLRKRGTDYRASPNQDDHSLQFRMQKRPPILSSWQHLDLGCRMGTRHQRGWQGHCSALTSEHVASSSVRATSAQVTEAFGSGELPHLPLPRSSCVSETEGESRSFSSLFSPKEHWAQQAVLGLSTEEQNGPLHGHGQPRCGPTHFLKGVSLVKVCQNSDGFRLGSARANTCCCGTLVGTVTWRWCMGCKLWCGGATGHPL